MSIARSQASAAAAWSLKKASGITPALFTSTSTAAHRSTAVPTTASRSARRVTSAPSPTASPPAATIEPAVAVAASPSTSHTTTRAPMAAVISASSRPNPPPAPVMTITLPATWFGLEPSTSCPATVRDDGTSRPRRRTARRWERAEPRSSSVPCTRANHVGRDVAQASCSGSPTTVGPPASPCSQQR